MNLDKLPDQPRPGSDRTLATIANVAAVMDEAGITARYNIIKKQIEIEVPEHKGTPDNLDNVTLTRIVSLCAMHEMPTGRVPDYVAAVADQHEYNPVADWIHSRVWDGQDRLTSLYATVIEQEDYPLELKQALLRKWLLSATAAALVPAYKGRGVLTLQGPQGIGKTSWVRALVSDSKLSESVVKLDHHLDASNKDTVIEAIEHWIVEIGELDSSFKKDVARLKGFLTRDSDKVRRHYDRRTSGYPRRTVFAATVNEANFLVDNTGNNRWWTLAVKDLNFNHSIDMQQLFAQLAVELEQGGQWWLSKDEEAMLDAWNDRHTAPSVVADMVMRRLDLTPGCKTKALTPTELLRIAGIDHPNNTQAKECGTLLRGLFGAPTKILGRFKWKVPLREPTADDLYEEPPAKTIVRCAPDEVF